MAKESVFPPDRPDGVIWTGEVQAIAFTDTPGTTAITIPGRWFRFYATTACHLNIGGSVRIHNASASRLDACFPLPAGAWSQPVYIPSTFDSGGDGAGTLYLSVVRNSANGTLYISQAYPTTDTRTVGATSTSTTT